MQKFHTDDGIWVVLLIDRAIGNLIQPIRSTTQIWVVTRHQYGICAVVSQTPFGGETSGSVAKCQLFSQASCWTVARDIENWPIADLRIVCKYIAIMWKWLSLLLVIQSIPGNSNPL